MNRSRLLVVLALPGLLLASAERSPACEPGKPPGPCRQSVASGEQTQPQGADSTRRTGFSHLISLPNSARNPDCNPWLTADEQEMFYIIRDGRYSPPQPGFQGDWDIYRSQWDPANQTWGPGTNLGPNINTAGTERRPSTTATGDTLFFERDDQILVAVRTGEVFGPPAVLFPGRDPAITSDLLHLYFVRGGDIWVADYDGSIYAWTNLHALGPPVNTNHAENRPFVSADGTRLFFSDFGNPRPGGYGGDDVWISNWTGSEWGTPVNMGPLINTDLWACSPFLSRDGKRFFTGGEAFEGSRGDEDLWVAFLDSAVASTLVTTPPGIWTKAGELPGAWNVYDLAVDTSGVLYAATMPGARVFRSSSGGHSWEPTAPLPAASIAYSLLAASDGSLYVGTYPHGDVFRTTNGGDSWEPTADLPAATAVRALLETADGRVLAGTSPVCRVYSTTTQGNAWDPLGAPADMMSGITTLFEASTGSLFAGGWGVPYRSDDGGVTWDPQSLDPYFGPNLSSIHSFLETEGGVLWCTGWVHAHGGYVFRSNDGGADWDTTGQVKVSSLRAIRVYDIVELEPGNLLIGFQTGPDSVAFVSSDAGESWAVDGTLPGAHEVLRFLQLPDGTVFAATAPNGDIYRRDPVGAGVDRSPEPARRGSGSPGVAAVLDGSPNPFSSGIELRFQVPRDGPARLSVLDAAGRMVRVLHDAETRAGTHRVEWDGTDAQGRRADAGVYFIRLEALGSVTYQKVMRVE